MWYLHVCSQSYTKPQCCKLFIPPSSILSLISLIFFFFCLTLCFYFWRTARIDMVFPIRYHQVLPCQLQPPARWNEEGTSGGRYPPPHPDMNQEIFPAPTACNIMSYPRGEE